MLMLLIIIGCNDSEPNTTIQQPQTSCLPTNLQNGVVAFYPFANGSLNDESGNNYNLINLTTASSAMDRSGNLNCAFGFNRVNNEFLEFPNPTFLDNLPSTGFSISFWYKSNNKSTGIFISRDEGRICPNTDGQWSVRYINNVNIFGANGATTSTYGIETSTWEHIVVTSNSNLIQIYKNGILEATSNNFEYCNSSNPTSNLGNLFVGKTYDGLIDDIIIYDRILSSSEVNELSNLPSCCL